MALERKEVLEKVQAIIVKNLGVDVNEVTEESSFGAGGLDIDSLDLVELIMCLEDAFNIKIPDIDASKITTVREAVDYIVKHQK